MHVVTRLGFAEAAALPVVALTAWQCVTRAHRLLEEGRVQGKLVRECDTSPSPLGRGSG